MKETIFRMDKCIALISMDRPHVSNALNGDLVDEINEILDNCAADPEVRCIVISGEGMAFCAGTDLDYLDGLDEQQTLEFLDKMAKLLERLQTISKPVIAMVNGLAAGAGLSMALACDMVYSADTAKYTQNCSGVGLLPDFGALFLMPKIMGKHKAKELMFTADTLSAPIAYRFGFISRICSSDNLYDDTMNMAKRIARVPSNVLALIKKHVNNDTLTLQQALEIERAEQFKLAKGVVFKECIAAIRENKRPKLKRLRG